MGAHFKAVIGKLRRIYLGRGFKENIVDAIALFADKMLMTFQQRIEVLRTTVHHYLQPVVRN